MLVCFVGAGAAVACNSLLGLTDFDVTPDPVVDGSTPDAFVEGDATSGSCADGQTSDVDLRVECYPCNPITTEQLLNTCTGAQCIPFDRARVTLLLADGGLPPLPPDPDGG